MNIGNRIYFSVLIDKVQEEEFLRPEDLMQFYIVESAGASLPMIYLKILVRNEAVMNKFKSNNIVKVSVGNTKEDADTFTFHPIEPAPNKDPSNSGWEVELVGFIGNDSYMFEQRSKAYEGNSLFVVDSVMKDYFGKEVPLSENKNYRITSEGKTIGKYMFTNFQRTNENQVLWRQNSTTASYFVADTLLHADVRPSFPLFSFDRYQTFYVRDINELLKQGPSITFVPGTPKDDKNIGYINNFNVESFKSMYDLYSGFGKVTETVDIKTGMKSFVKAVNNPILASSAVAEKMDGIAETLSLNNTQSGNVHKTYSEAFAYNANRLVALSSMLGVLYTSGTYHHKVKPTDLVSIQTDERDTDISGNYLVDTVVTAVNFGTQMFNTIYYVTRDNKNNIENYVITSEFLRIKDKLYNNLLSAISDLKYVYATAIQFIDGRFLSKVLSYAIETKNNLLRSFNVSGVMIDLADYAKGTINSLIATGNSLLNTLFDMIFPYQIANSLRDVVTMERNSLGVISKYVSEYVPVDVQGVVMKLVEALYGVTDTLNSISEDNKRTTMTTEQTIGQKESVYIAEGKQRVTDILNTFENNTTGLDIPLPIISLTESQSILPEEELRELIANETIDTLINANYLTNDIAPEFKEILLGNSPIDFSIISQINENAGNTMYYRFWGTFGDIALLDSYTVRQGYKDKYRTLPCTKLISAVKDSKIFFACPSREENLKFYVNSKRIELQSFETDLGYKSAYNIPLLYTVYYTNTGYNSNSVLFEVKQGGLS